jgi:hypothetical protein
LDSSLDVKMLLNLQRCYKVPVNKKMHPVNPQPKLKKHRTPVTHVYNPNDVGGRDGKDLGLRPAQANSL